MYKLYHNVKQTFTIQLCARDAFLEYPSSLYPKSQKIGKPYNLKVKENI